MSMTDEEKRELRNSVFAAQKAAEQMNLPTTGIPVQTQQQAAQQATGMSIPVALVPLPSAGLVYNTPGLKGVSELEIRHMAAREEDILMNQVYMKKGTTTSELVKSCLIDKTIDVGSLIGGDLTALLVAIRVTGYGSEYDFKVKCPSCEAEQQHVANLNELNIKELDLELLQQVAPFENCFQTELPVSKKKVTFKFLTTRDQEMILADMTAKKKKGLQTDNLITTKLANCVLSIDGETNKGKIRSFCEFMPAGDSRHLRKLLDNSEPGIDMTTTFVCKSCDYEEVMAIPMGVTFLWPDAK